ncbi:MAG: type IV pilus secretin PilQ, partial [Myxococcota bacterium]|nr:type IV pilus secretin PilQ [Myxococcota bacterium]
ERERTQHVNAVAAKASAAEARARELERKMSKMASHVSRAARAARAARPVTPTATRGKRPAKGRSGRVPVVTNVTYKDKGQAGEVRISLTEKASYEVIRRGPYRIEMKLRGTTIPRELERSLDANDLKSPVRLVSSFRGANEPGTVRVVVDLKSAAADDLKVADKTLIWSFRHAKPGMNRSQAQASASPNPPPAPRMPPGVRTYPGAVGAEGGTVTSPGGGGVPSASKFMENRRKRRARKYKGKKINLTIKDADIQHVLTFLAKEGSVNIVASEDVKGSVTFHLENIPWDLALDMILKTQGYDYVKEAGVYRVAPAEDIQKEYEAELKKKQTIDELKPMVVRFVTVNYADLSDVAEHVKTVLSKNGTATADPSTSTLIIKDIEEHVQAADDIVRRLDVQLPQVLIEARIVEASTNFSKEMGVQWGGEFLMSPAFGNPTGLAFPAVVGVAGGSDDPTAPSAGLRSSAPNFAVNLPAAAGAGAGGALGLTLGSLGGVPNLSLRLSAAEEEGQVKIVSAPKILTIDGKKATIRQGVAIPISVVSANGVNTQFFNADLKLEVQTNTSPDGNIRMDLAIMKNEPDFGQTATNGAPTIQKKEATTSLLIRDGDTTVLGGIFTRNSGESTARVPFLSRIPILGWFFQNHRETDQRSEMLIFITPRIANRRASLVDSKPL